MKQIPLSTLESLYKKSEIATEILSGLLQAISEHGLGDKESSEHAGQFLLSLSKASNYDMTLMFIDDNEKDIIKKIVQK